MIEPVGHRVLVKPDKIEEIDPVFKQAKQAGIVFEEFTEARREQDAVVVGTILKIGSTAWKDPSLGGVPWAQEGDRVYFAKFAGKKVKENDDEFLILNDEDIVAIIRG